MPDIIRCPACGRALRLPANAQGRKIRCPQCNNVFATPAGAGGDTEDLPEERVREGIQQAARRQPREEGAGLEGAAPVLVGRALENESTTGERRARRKRSREEKANWRRVHLGMALILVGVGLLAGGMLLKTFGAAVAAGAQQAAQGPDALDPRGSAGVSRFFFLAGLLLIVVARGLMLLGNVGCLFAPPRYGARVLAIASLALLGTSALFSCVSGVSLSLPPMPGSLGVGVTELSDLASLLGIAQVIVLLFFLRAVARMLEEQWLVQHALYLAILSGAAELVSCGGFCVAAPLAFGLLARDQGAAFGVVGLLLFLLGGLLWLAALGWYVFVLFHVRQAVGKQLAD
jgi:hypothetical protein